MTDTIVEIWIMHTPRGDFEFGYKPGECPAPFKEAPVWMSNLKKHWDHPQGPITFEFTLTDDTYSQDAFNYLYNGPANDIKYPVQEAV